MSKIESQAIKSTMLSYVGILLGFISVGYLFPLVLSKSELGAIRLIAQYAEISAKVVALGSSTLIVRYFTRFKDAQNQHNGILFWLIVLNLIGFGIFMTAYVLGADFIITRNTLKSPIFASYFSWIVPLTLGMAVFNLFDSYLTALKRSTIGFLTKDFIQRLGIVLLLILATVVTIPFHQFATSYFIILLSTPLIMMGYTFLAKEFKIWPRVGLFTKPLIKEMSSVASFAVLTGIGGALMVFIDSIMLNELINESSLAVYTTLAYYAILITVPARGVTKIGSAVIAEALHENRLDQVKSIYYKSCINQLIPGAFVFVLLLVNLEFIFYILPESYAEGFWLIGILGIGHLCNVMTGINTQIIAFSPLHKFNTVFVFGLIALAIVSNYLLIPVYGLNGAAIATSLSLFAFNLAKYLLLKWKYHFQPFSTKYLWVFLLTIGSIACTHWISFSNVWVNAFVKTILAASLFAGPVLYYRLSPEITEMARKKIGVLKRRLS